MFAGLTVVDHVVMVFFFNVVFMMFTIAFFAVMAEAVTVFTIKAWIVVAVHAVMAEAVAVFAIKARIVVAVHAVMTEAIAVFAIEVAVVFAVHAVRTEVFASAFAFKAITTFAFTHERYWMLTIAFEAFMAFVVMHTRRQQGAIV